MFDVLTCMLCKAILILFNCNLEWCFLVNFFQESPPLKVRNPFTIQVVQCLLVVACLKEAQEMLMDEIKNLNKGYFYLLVRISIP